MTLIKDLTVKGAGQTLKRGTLIKSIRLTGDAQEIDCRYEGDQGVGAAGGVCEEAVSINLRTQCSAFNARSIIVYNEAKTPIIFAAT